VEMELAYWELENRKWVKILFENPPFVALFVMLWKNKNFISV
jgi:hypothetical protein